MKQITALWPKECILCTTQNECDIIIDTVIAAVSCLDLMTPYRYFKPDKELQNQCFCVYTWNRISKEKSEERWYTIYPASDFIEKERKPKQGEGVLVRDCDEDEWVERIFLCEVPQLLEPYICVFGSAHYERCYLEWKKVQMCQWKQIKQLPKEVKSTYTLELTEEQYKKVQDLINK